MGIICNNIALEEWHSPAHVCAALAWNRDVVDDLEITVSSDPDYVLLMDVSDFGRTIKQCKGEQNRCRGKRRPSAVNSDLPISSPPFSLHLPVFHSGLVHFEIGNPRSLDTSSLHLIFFATLPVFSIFGRLDRDACVAQQWPRPAAVGGQISVAGRVDGQRFGSWVEESATDAVAVICGLRWHTYYIRGKEEVGIRVEDAV